MRSVSSEKAILGCVRTVLLLLLLVPAFQAARAEEPSRNGITVVDKALYNKAGTSALFVVTHKIDKDNPQKFAAIGIQFEHDDENYHFDGTYKKLIVSFETADDWQKFVALWRKSGTAAGQSTDVGDYFDGDTLLSLGTYGDGDVDISFTMAGNGHNANNIPNDMTIFDLPHKNFAAFDRIVKKVSAYFGK
jgi:hypothetical protein